MEVRSEDGKIRSDVLVHAATAEIAHEVQITRIQAATIDRRSRAAERAGLLPNRIVPDLKSPAIDFWPFARMPAFSAREIVELTDLPIETAVWDVPLQKCAERAQRERRAAPTREVVLAARTGTPSGSSRGEARPTTR